MFTHQTAKHQTTKQRPAYSLVELLVVLGIILGVMGMVMAIYPSYNQREEMYKSADIVRNSLMRARQWAIRDKAITGIRFNTLSGNRGMSLTFVQSPPILYGFGTNLRIEHGLTLGAIDLNMIVLKKYIPIPFPSGPWTQTNVNFSPPIDREDYLVTNQANFINSAVISGTTLQYTLTFPDPVDLNGNFFHVQRKPAPIPSEPVLDFSKSPGIVVDLSSSGGSNTILFNANGQCMPKNTGVITIKVVQTDPGTPYIKPAPDSANSNVVLTLVESAALANVAINETYINIDAATGVSKVLGGAP